MDRKVEVATTYNQKYYDIQSVQKESEGMLVMNSYNTNALRGPPHADNQRGKQIDPMDSEYPLIQ